MNEFDSNGYNTQGDGNSQRPDYYNGQPQNGSNQGTGANYYTPPQGENGSYHYSYGSQNNGGNPQYSYNQPNGGDNKPPKKSKASVIIVIVIVACLAVAGVGIAFSLIGGSGNSTDNSTTQSSQKQDDNDNAASVEQGGNVPLKDGEDYTVAGVADAVMDSCVGITVYSQQSEAYNYFYGRGGNSKGEPVVSSEGSGVIMSEKDGVTYIMTCAHVISDGDSFKVTLNDGTKLDASVVGFDSQTDIGVLKVDKTGLKVAKFADSKKLVVGEQVVAIGCPGGLEFMNSVTSGYISALDRPISSPIGYDYECIQTDAAINFGNSGGALFNMQGQVIGINSSKVTATSYEGMGFAVPSSTAIETANSIIRVGYVEGRAKLGIKYNPITNFNNYENVLEALDDAGFDDANGTMVIRSVNSDSDLVNKDIKEYDMIVAVEGKVMTSTDVMTSVLADSKPGDTIKLTIARIEGNRIKTFTVECKLIESKGND